MKRMLSWLCALLLMHLSPSPASAGPSLRALLVGCDTFITKEATYPIAQNNLHNLSQTLLADTRSYRSVNTYYDEISNVPAFERAVQSAFSEAGENDISIVYFSTHGYLAEDQTSASLYLSNGMEENLLSADALYRILSHVPGQKIILLDACNSGAFIAKGINAHLTAHPFTGRDFHVLTSSGGSEPSWQWHGESELISGSGYFTDMLCAALSGGVPSDTNRDGTVTLYEAFSFVSLNIGASTPQCYPENSAVPFFTYSEAAHSAQLISDIVFNDTLLTSGRSTLTFSFTAHAETPLYYQIIYFREGAWDFENPRHFQDDETGTGTITPGRKERSLLLDMPNGDDYGYAMIQFITLQDEQPVFQGARLLSVQPRKTDMEPEITTAAAFDPSIGEEMPLLVTHTVPCAMSVTVRDSAGKTIKRLSYDQPTRPQHLSPPASSFYWDGTDNKGNAAPAGFYYAQVKTTLGEHTITAYSAPFQLIETNGGQQNAERSE